MASAPPPLACHLASLLRAIRSTDEERRSIERRSCVKNLATRLGCIGALHPPAVLGLSASTEMKNLRFDRDWVLCPIVIRAPLTTGVGVRFLSACRIELAIHHAARHGRFLFNRAWGQRLQSRMGRGFQSQYMLHVQMTFGVSCLNCAWALCSNHASRSSLSSRKLYVSTTLGNLGLNHEFLNSRAPLRFAAAFDGRSSRFRVYDNAPS